MLEHHRRVAGDHFPVRDPDDSWVRTRADYERWLLDGDAMLVIARDAASWRPVGYVLYVLTKSGATFDLGPLCGEVHSLVVDDEARGSGIGTELLEAVRSDLRDRGIDYWSVGVLAGNGDAERLYRRLGFQPWNHSLLASTREDATAQDARRAIDAPATRTVHAIRPPLELLDHQSSAGFGYLTGAHKIDGGPGVTTD